ncbi:MAG: C2 family cysteine protease [Candidatus Sericytochromatia bacterium]
MSGNTISAFRPQTIQALTRLDSNNNGVTTQELAQVDSDHDGSITATEAAAQGIDANDVSAVNTAYQAHASEPNAVAFDRAGLQRQSASQAMLSVFSRVDGDSDGYLSRTELNNALHSSSYTGQDAAALAAMNNYVGDIEEYSNDENGDENDGITQADLRAFINQSDETATNISNMVQYGNNTIAGTNRTPFPNGVNSIRPDNIRQGMIGDCYFLAAVASEARTPEGRQRIHDMIHDNGNGTYDVTFPGRDAVTVSAPTDAELAAYSSAGSDGTWLSILEKAYAQSENNGAWSSSENPYDEIGDGNSLAAGIEAMTGHSVDTDDTAFTSVDTLRTKVSDAMAHGRTVTAGITEYPWSSGREANGLPQGHAYTVLNYDAATDSVTLRNPWGHGEPVNASGQAADGNDDGTFTMTLAEFDQYFSDISYEQAE